MSTVAYDNTKYLAREWENAYKSAICSGICGDDAHRRRGGFHIGRKFNPRGNYSIVRSDDQGGPDDASTGIDMSMSKVDMILCTTRLRAVWRDKTDPRRKYLNAFNGWLGSGAPIRFDMVSGKKSLATIDHTWHVHLEERRKWCLSRVAADAILSVLRGQSKADYLKSIGVATGAVTRPGTPAPGPIRRIAPRYAGTPLTLGVKNSSVRVYQQRMIARGYRSIGKVDGDFGPKCVQVTKAFQRLCRIKADGTVGPQTWPLPWTRPI